MLFRFPDPDWDHEKSTSDYAHESRRVFNPEQLDKLDYFIAELKKHGIDSNLNLKICRLYNSADQVQDVEYPEMVEAATLFDGQLIMLQKEYARQLFAPENLYTGNHNDDEPALIRL